MLILSSIFITRAEPFISGTSIGKKPQKDNALARHAGTMGRASHFHLAWPVLESLVRDGFPAERYSRIPPPYRQGDYGWAPDLAFVRAEQLPAMQAAIVAKQYIPFAPDLVVEIISPSQSRKDATDKAQTWLASGTRLVWNIWIDERQVEVWQPDEPMYTLNAQDRLDGRDVVPDFTMPVAELFVF